MEENNIIEMNEEVMDQNQELDTVEENGNAGAVVALAAGACVLTGVILTKVGEKVIPKIVSGAKKVGTGIKNAFSKPKVTDNVVEGDFEVVDDEVDEEAK